MSTDPTLSALLSALAQAPGNLRLLEIVCALPAVRTPPGAADLLAHLRTVAPASLASPEAARHVAEAVLAAGDPDLATRFVPPGGSAADLALMARIHEAAGRAAEATACRFAAEALGAAAADTAPTPAVDAAPPTPAGSPLRGRFQVIEGDLGAHAQRGAERPGGGPQAPSGNRADDGEEGGWSDPKVVPFIELAKTRVTFADVGGLEDVKDQIRRRIILPFQRPGLFGRFRRRAGGGVLVFGPPGCGKTLIARATAGECQAKFLNVAITDVLDMFIGESERKLATIFAEARRQTPCVLFFDELEALAAKRRYDHGASSSSSVVSTFLTELDGFADNNQGVLVLAATNVPWAIDSAFRRPGRFDRVLFVPPPDRAAREAILRLLLRGRPGAEALDVATIAGQTSGFSGADLENLVDTACDHAIADSLATGDVPLQIRHIRAALQEVKPTTLEWLTTARNYAKYANESGQYDDVLAFLDRHARG